jgi:biotin---protein ligase
LSNYLLLNQTASLTCVSRKILPLRLLISRRNPRFLSKVPEGLVSVATHQIAGRGRGGNTWVSPAGCLQFSLVLRLPQALASRVVFVQYLFALAVVEAVRSRQGYEGVPARIKWPNDIYVHSSKNSTSDNELKKIGGILVNSSFEGSQFSLVVGNRILPLFPWETMHGFISNGSFLIARGSTGCGINVTNPRPTASLQDLIAEYEARAGVSLPPLSQEQVLASILATFEPMWTTFLSSGFEPFMSLYETHWLHSYVRITCPWRGRVPTCSPGIFRVLEEIRKSQSRKLVSASGSRESRPIMDCCARCLFRRWGKGPMWTFSRTATLLTCSKASSGGKTEQPG